MPSLSAYEDTIWGISFFGFRFSPVSDQLQLSVFLYLGMYQDTYDGDIMVNQSASTEEYAKWVLSKTNASS